MKPLISVIVPTYNHSEFIIETLQSVLQQTFTDYECLIVNDGSTDNTEETVKNWITRDKRFRYFYQNNGGPARARNKGISSSAGKYILPLDSDDKISKNYLEEAVKVLDSQKEVKVVYGDGYFFGKANRNWDLGQYNFEDLLYKNMVYCTGLFRKEDWKRIGGYDESLKEGLEDWEFWINLLKDGGKVTKLKHIQFYYRQKNTSLNTESIQRHSYGYNARVYIFEKHIDLYRKSNFYDMYYENYNLRRCVREPLHFLTIKALLFLIFEAIKRKALHMYKKSKRKLRRSFI